MVGGDGQGGGLSSVVDEINAFVVFIQHCRVVFV